ncbi:MAG: hypothetical protein HY033_09040 [Ignavibacteriae bacterium]|nr:hypothetical protein [Ignavibacteria bacterium]MBI3365036.1 hypothetical protein [Ignavibacteriota bacterium]
MNADFPVTVVVDNELIARFILRSNWIHKKDNTPSQNAFLPPSDLKLSVTRHVGLSEIELWRHGKNVATARSLTLYGRADILALLVRKQSLLVDSEPIPGNENHANITGWPPDKDRRKSIALELAREASYHPNPEPVNQRVPG